MRKIFVALAGILGILVAVPAPGYSEDYPWCTEFDPFTKNCTFASYNECHAVASTVGATCIHNSNFRAAPPASAQQKASRKQH